MLTRPPLKPLVSQGVSQNDAAGVKKGGCALLFYAVFCLKTALIILYYPPPSVANPHLMLPANCRKRGIISLHFAPVPVFLDGFYNIKFPLAFPAKPWYNTGQEWKNEETYMQGMRICV